MADQEQPDLLMFWKEGLDLLRQGVEVWNRWRQEHADIMPILYEANLDTSDLCGINFSGAYLVGAHFKVANLRGANLSRASLSRADLWGADLSGADLTGADLSGATLIRTNLSRATLVDCSVYGISAWGVQLEGTRQENLLVTDRGEPAITVDNLEVAQFIYLLLNHKKLRDIFNAVTERGVLILGRFGGGGLEVLQAVANRLREEQYLVVSQNTFLAF